MPDIYDWSLEAGDNGNSDGDIDMAEGMAPSNVNNGIRQIMARVKEFVNDLTGVNTVGGTANAITVFTASGFTAYQTGIIVAFRASATNTGAVLLSANGLISKSIRKFNGTTDVVLTGGEIKAKGRYACVYDETLVSGAGAWALLNPAQGTVIVDDGDWDGAPLSIAHGGTGQDTAPEARDALGLEIGVDVQAFSAVLAALAAASSPAANKIPYLTSATTAAFTPLTTFARTLLDDTDAATARGTLALKNLAAKDDVDLFYAGSDVDNVTFPIGQILACVLGGNPPRNATVTPRLGASANFYTDSGAGALLAGTWKSNGAIDDSNTYLIQRAS